MTGDSELLRCYADASSEAAFAELVERNIGLVYHAALRQLGGDAHKAEDVTQAVFTDLARKAAGLAGHPALTSWLYTSTRFAAAKVRRAEQTRRKHEREAEFMQALRRDERSAADWERLRPIIDDVIHELGERDREAVLLRFFKGRSFKEVGAALAMSEDAARMRVERALDKLHGLLATRGVTSTSGALAAALASQATAAAPTGLAASVAGTALSGAAAAGAGTFATVLYFMSASKITLSLAVAGALAVATAVYQSGRASTATAELAQANGEQAALSARLAELERSVAAAEQQRADRQAALDRRQAEKPVTRAVPATVADNNAKYLEIYNELKRNDAELKRARLAKSVASARVAYRPLFRSLGFSPEQIDRALALLVEPTEPQANAGPDALARFRQQFGDAAADRLDEFQRTAGARDLVNDLSNLLAYTDAPFSPAEVEQLVRLISEAGPTVRAVRERFGGFLADDAGAAEYRQTRDWDRILRQAPSWLTPEHLRGLQAMAALARNDARTASAR